MQFMLRIFDIGVWKERTPLQMVQHYKLSHHVRTHSNEAHQWFQKDSSLKEEVLAFDQVEFGL